MTNTLNDLTDLYRSLNVNGEQEECNLEAIMKINSYLNSSLDLRNVISDQPPQQQSNSNTSIDAYLNELVNGTDRVDAGPTTVQKTSVSSTGPCNIEGTAARSRFLSPSFSYSSDSSASPHSPFNPHSVPQVCSRNDVFNCYDESSHSSGSSNFYSPSMPQRMRISAASDPGSPTLEDAILMGCQNDNVFGTDINANKINDIMLADLVSSLSLGSGNGHSNTYSPLNNLPSCGISRNSGITNHLVGSVDSQQLPGSSMLGLQHPSSLCNINNQLYGMNSFHKQQQRAVAPFSSGIDTNSAALQNALLASQICPNLIDRGSFLTGGNDRSPNMANFQTGDAYFIEKAAKMHRNAAAVCDAACTWSGQLPPRIHKNPIYSCKVFLGGVPWDVTECVLKQTFIQFGNIRVEWPGKEFSANLRKGYVYILFEHEKQVKSLLASCCQDFSMSGNYYFKVSSRRMRQKDVQIIPWVISDSNYVRCPSYLLDPAKTVFVGALHGMLSAESLANIMNDLFGGVVFAGIDTDKHKYPIGSGRVTFNNVQSYRKAVRAAFIEIKTQKFTKKVQVDPYLADSMCQLCVVQQGPFFCRDENCFKYFCRSCWQMTHPQDSHGHKPLMRNPKLCTQTTLNRVI